MTWLVDDVEAIHRIRLIARDGMLAQHPLIPYGFDGASGRDYSSNKKPGNLFKQDADFVLFEPEVDTTRRAGPSKVSPTRYWGTLVISLFSKDDSADLDHQRLLRVFSGWFEEKTVRDIRFRTLTPMSTARVMGFICFSGVLNFEFETNPKDTIL